MAAFSGTVGGTGSLPAAVARSVGTGTIRRSAHTLTLCISQTFPQGWVVRPLIPPLLPICQKPLYVFDGSQNPNMPGPAINKLDLTLA